VAVTDPGADYPSEQRCQLDDVVMLELAGGLNSAQAHRSSGRRTSIWGTVAAQDPPVSGGGLRVPWAWACVMGSLATSQYQ
jgi:hypothetical protein